MQNSIIIDSRIEDPSSLVERTVVLGSWIGRLISGPGAVVVQSKCGSLEMDGPHSISYRVQGDRQIGGSEIVAGISLPNSIVHLSHDDPMRTVTPEIFMTPQGGNSMSFADASESVANIAASELDAQWLRVLDWDGFGQANEEGTN